MNSEPKPFASLSSGLLARKGAARPAMRPQGFGGQQAGTGLDDLGWNDMGFEPPKPAETSRDAEHDAFGEELASHPLRNPLAALTPVNSPVHDQQAEIADRLVAEADEEEALDEDFDETAELVEGDELPEAVLAPALEPQIEPEIQPAPVAIEVAVAAPVAVPRPRRQPRQRSAPGTGAKAAFTLRLDPTRHLKLRLACAVNGRSAQQIVTDAVDRLLAEMPELESMAERAPAKRAQA
jgi:hypothetical protein